MTNLYPDICLFYTSMLFFAEPHICVDFTIFFLMRNKCPFSPISVCVLSNLHLSDSISLKRSNQAVVF